jgi:hypothetical protein
MMNVAQNHNFGPGCIARRVASRRLDERNSEFAGSAVKYQKGKTAAAASARQASSGRIGGQDLPA